MCDYPEIEWGFGENKRFLSEILSAYSWNDQYLTMLDELIFVLKSQKCQGIQEKLHDVASFKKLSSTISELRIAKVIGRQNPVNLLPDGYNGGGSPDMAYSFEGRDFIVEITRIGNDGASGQIIDFLHPLLRDYEYWVDCTLKPEIAHPRLTAEEREQKEALIAESLDFFVGSFRAKIGEEDFTIDTPGISFEVERSSDGRGHLGFVSSGAIRVNNEYMRNYLKRRILEKAKKYERYNEAFPGYKYLIAVACDEGFIDQQDAAEALYGSRVEIVASNERQRAYRENDWNKILKERERTIPAWDRIMEAAGNGWGELLMEEHLIPNDYVYLREKGSFLDDSVMNNVSGVIITHPGGDVSFFPNPFCEDGLNLGGDCTIF